MNIPIGLIDALDMVSVFSTLGLDTTSTAMQLLALADADVCGQREVSHDAN